MAEYLTMAVYEHARKNQNIPKWAQVFKSLDEERIAGIVLDGDSKTFWYEHNTYHENAPQKVYSTITKYLKEAGYKYLYEDVA